MRHGRAGVRVAVRAWRGRRRGTRRRRRGPVADVLAVLHHGRAVLHRNRGPDRHGGYDLRRPVG